MSACDSSKKTVLGRHQKAVVAMARVLCREKFPNRGVLVWHSLGSGKTLAGISAFDAMWDQKPRKKLVYVTSVEGIAANPPSTFYKYAMALPRFKD